MKEQRYFFVPSPADGVLPDDEAQHALRVLRLTVGDEFYLTDGQGACCRAVISEADNHRRCRFRVVEQLNPQPEWRGRIHVAVAPTKNMDRMEWLAEKATEVGWDRLSMLCCRFSERKAVKTERLEKIVVAAMKQSHKAWKPQVDEVQPFSHFIRRDDLPQQRFIAHCYEEQDVAGSAADGTLGGKPFLLDVLQPCTDALVLIGPEGDFSIDEVRQAVETGFRPISLGTSRLRTETAALVAVHLMRLANRLPSS